MGGGTNTCQTYHHHIDISHREMDFSEGAAPVQAPFNMQDVGFRSYDSEVHVTSLLFVSGQKQKSARHTTHYSTTADSRAFVAICSKNEPRMFAKTHSGKNGVPSTYVLQVWYRPHII